MTPRELPLEQHSSSSKGYSPNSSGSSIHTNQEPLQVSNVSESRVTNKPMMKVFPVYNKEDHRSLTAQNKHLRELLQTQTEEIMSLSNLDRENQDIVHNLKARYDNKIRISYTK